MNQRELVVVKMAIRALEVKPNYVVEPYVTSARVIGLLKEIVAENAERKLADISFLVIPPLSVKKRKEIQKIFDKAKSRFEPTKGLRKKNA